MKAVIYTKYGPPNTLQLAEVQKPQPQDHEVLIKIHATTVTSGDVRLRSSDFPMLAWLPARLMFGLFKPRFSILGHELSGTVEAVGKEVSKYKVGDEVFASTGVYGNGSYTEYICIAEERKQGVMGLKPKNLDFNKAAALPVGGMTALVLLNKAKLGKAQDVLVYGASGSVGSYAIQIAKEQQANVVAVCSGDNFDMVRSLGADSTIDYLRQDYSLLDHTFDIVFDAVGKTSKKKARNVLKEGGQFVSVKSLTSPKQEHLNTLHRLAEKGSIRPYIDSCYALADIAAAHEYVDKGRKKGNVVIEIAK